MWRNIPPRRAWAGIVGCLLFLSAPLVWSGGILEVFSPASGHQWQTGTTASIRWNKGNAGKRVRIELHKAGRLVRMIRSRAYNTGNYRWRVPRSIKPGLYTIKIRSGDYRQISAVSDEFRITYRTTPRHNQRGENQPQINAPVGGEILVKNTRYLIEWDDVTDALGVHIEIHLQRGAGRVAVLDDNAVNSGRYLWVAPGRQLPSGRDYRIRLQSKADKGRFALSGSFAIATSQPEQANTNRLRVMLPSNRQRWGKGRSYSIRWLDRRRAAGSTVRIELYRSGKHYHTIAQRAANRGRYRWRVPHTLVTGAHYQIRVTSLNNANISGSSTGHFTVSGRPTGRLYVMSPTSGREVWQAGQVQTIKWKKGRAGRTVRIDLYQSGRLYKTLSRHTRNDGAHRLRVPSTIATGPNYAIRIQSEDPRRSRVYNFSDKTFAIHNAKVPQVLVPDQAEESPTPESESPTPESESLTGKEQDAAKEEGKAPPQPGEGYPFPITDFGDFGNPTTQGSAINNLYLTSRIGGSKEKDQDRSAFYTLVKDNDGNYSVVFKPVGGLPNPQCEYDGGGLTSCITDAIYPGIISLTPAQFLYVQLNTKAKRQNDSYISPISRFLHSLRIEVALNLFLKHYNQLNSTDFSIGTLPESINYQCNDSCIKVLGQVLGDDIEDISKAIAGKTIKVNKEMLSGENLRFDYRLTLSICNSPDVCFEVDKTLYKNENDGSFSSFRVENDQDGQHTTNIKIIPEAVSGTDQTIFTYKWEYISAPPDLNNDGQADFENHYGLHVYRGIATTPPIASGQTGNLVGFPFPLTVNDNGSESTELVKEGWPFETDQATSAGNAGIPIKNVLGCFRIDQKQAKLVFSSVTGICEEHKTLALGTEAVDSAYDLVSSADWTNDNPSRLDFNDLSFSCKDFEDNEKANYGCYPLVDINNWEVEPVESSSPFGEAKINKLRCLYEGCQILYGFNSDCNELTGEESYATLVEGAPLGLNQALQQWKESGEENNLGRCLLLKANSLVDPPYGQVDPDDGKLLNPYRLFLSDSGTACNLPECKGGPYFTELPVKKDDILSIVPLGNLSPPGHTHPTDHIYIHGRDINPFDDKGANVTKIYAPGDATIVKISSSEHKVGGFTDYKIILFPCKTYSLEFSHVQVLSDELQAIFDEQEASGVKVCDEYTTGGETYELCHYTGLSISVKAGEYLGTFGGNKKMNSLDVWAWDYSKVSNTFASIYAEGGDKAYAVCPLNEFSAPKKKTLEDRLGSPDGKFKREDEPLCGKFTQDIPNYAQGQWYRQGQENSGSEDPHITFGHDNVKPEIGVFSIGTSIPDIGGSIQMFDEPVFEEGVFNRDFSQVTNNGKTYFYKTHPKYPKDPTELTPGSILIKMTSAKTILVEYRKNFDCESTGTYKIDGENSVIFVR